MPPSPEDIIPHIFLPLPNHTDLSKPNSKEERLKTIISNLDKQHQTVRLGIISAAKEKLQTQNLALQPDDPLDHMDIDDDDDEEEEGEYRRGRPLPSQEHAISSLVANLNVPYHESMGDLCVPKPPLDGSAPAPFAAPALPGIRQVTPPPEVQVAKETLETIEKYDQHAKKTRKFYADALERLTKRNSTGGSSGSWSAGGYHDRAGSGSGSFGGASSTAGGAGLGGYRVNASPIDFARDPRRQQHASPNDILRDPRLRR